MRHPNYSDKEPKKKASNRSRIKSVVYLRNLPTFQKEIKYIFLRSGWNQPHAIHVFMSIIKDITLASERWGDGMPALYRLSKSGEVITPNNKLWDTCAPSHGVAVHLMDAVLKIFNLFELSDWDVEKAILSRRDDLRDGHAPAPKI